MAWTYGGKALNQVRQGTTVVVPAAAQRVSRHPILGAGGGELLQIGGAKNASVKARWVVDGTTYATLRALADGTPRTLTGVPSTSGGTESWANMVLLFEDDPDRGQYVGSQSAYEIAFSFEQVPA